MPCCIPTPLLHPNTHMVTHMHPFFPLTPPLHTSHNMVAC